MTDTSSRTPYRVSCPCGTSLRIDALKAERRLRCPTCGLVLSFVVTMDGRSRRPRVSIVVAPEAMKPEGESLATVSARKGEPPAAAEPKASRTRVGGRTVRGVLGTCACGTSFPVDDQELASIQACPQCGTRYHVVVKVERGTRKKTAILVPVDPQPGRRPAIAPAPPPATRAGRRTQVLGRGRTRVSRPPPPKPPIPPGAQGVDCPCGATLAVRRKDVARGMDCPACGRAVRFREVHDPQTLAPRIRIDPDAK
jgi:DNA-directed RNA polymerase subunit RPC12/RpoP